MPNRRAASPRSSRTRAAKRWRHLSASSRHPWVSQLRSTNRVETVGTDDGSCPAPSATHFSIRADIAFARIPCHISDARCARSASWVSTSTDSPTLARVRMYLLLDRLASDLRNIIAVADRVRTNCRVRFHRLASGRAHAPARHVWSRRSTPRAGMVTDGLPSAGGRSVPKRTRHSRRGSAPPA
jgi:hypothetical protein